MKAYAPYITAMAALLPHGLGTPFSTRDDSKMVFGFSEVRLILVVTTELTRTNS